MKTYFLGITGGIGSGKTEACHQFEKLGARIFNSDLEAKRIMNNDLQVIHKIKEQFGEQSYTTQGLDRKYLAKKVFADKSALEILNNIVHPKVFEAFDGEKQRAEDEGIKLLIKEAALIYETGGEKNLDGVLVISAPKDKSVERVVKRDNVEAEDVLKRLSHQDDPQEKIKKSDFHIENNGTLEQLQEKVRDLYHQIIS